ncbi:hypothetical protein AVEN_156571-1 [Araneus ventricosus]|uniref:CRAL-TRIO domain-containing protein n=1 Tax=Araneus ventricosus TaxID=182803 RepID=A0A4Y2Q1D6_ARAVE|nr:hypothetical protein AVEN_156571-1 [Araneus ventricosus]
MKDGHERFEQFKTNKSTLAFIVNPLNTNINEINIEPFGIDAGSLQMRLLDLKTKDLWSGKFTELKSKMEELEVQKCMHIAQQKWTSLKEIPRVEALIFGAWYSLPECYSEVKKLAYGVLTIFRSTYSCEQEFSCMNIIKKVYFIQDCIPGRYKEIHMVNESILLKTLWAIVRNFISEKIRSRIFFHSKPEDLLNYFPRSVLPAQYGGDLINYINKDSGIKIMGTLLWKGTKTTFNILTCYEADFNCI